MERVTHLPVRPSPVLGGQAALVAGSKHAGMPRSQARGRRAYSRASFAAKPRIRREPGLRRLGLGQASPESSWRVISVVEHLAVQGYRPTLRPGARRSDGSRRTRVVVRTLGRECELLLREDLPEVFHLSHCRRLSEAAPAEEALLRAAQHVGNKLLCTKVELLLDAREVVFTFESLLYTAEDFPRLFHHACRALQHGVEAFDEYLDGGGEDAR